MRDDGALEALAGVVREDVLARREEPPDLGIALRDELDQELLPEALCSSVHAVS